MRPWFAAMLSLGIAVLAHAADPCLSGDSELSDQRALASLRGATELSCPCASATTAGSYKKCASAALKSALASGALRAECKKTATAINKGAVCGSTKVACGRFTPTAKTPLSCKLKASRSCKDGKKYEENACIAQTHCADVTDWTASTCVDPRQDGPFGAGVQIIRFTKKSVVNPTADRVLDTVVWYPTSPDAEPVAPAYGGVLNAALDTSGGPYPLLMFSHGSCGYPAQATYLTPQIASYGFIVVAPPHPGNTIADLPGCTSSQTLINSAQERPQDIEFVLNAMLAANQDPTSPFFGTIDTSKLGMSGHSFGGFTTYAATAQDSRFKMAMAFAPFVEPGQQLTIPSLTMLGQIDSVVNDDAIRAAYASSSSPKYRVEIKNTGHYAWSDLCFPSPDCQPPATLTQDEAHDAVRRWVVPFLEVYLVGDPSFAPFLAPVSGPGFLFDAAP